MSWVNVKSVLLIHDSRNCSATYLKLEVYDLATENGVVVYFSNFYFIIGMGASYWFTDLGRCCRRRWRCWRIQDLHIHFKLGFQHWLLPAGWPLSQENNFALIRLAICTSAIQIRVLSSIMVHMYTHPFDVLLLVSVLCILVLVFYFILVASNVVLPKLRHRYLTPPIYDSLGNCG